MHLTTHPQVLANGAKIPNGGNTEQQVSTTPVVPPHHQTQLYQDPIRRAQERENLRNIIAQWNANRLDLFEISEPNEDLEFYGVMRFYFQDAGQKVATKCMRISSTASTGDVINNLIEKFRPDIRMLSVPDYALYEIHENGDERKLSPTEFPLLVQLNWHKDDREGRFLLRRMDEKTYLPGFGSEANASTVAPAAATAAAANTTSSSSSIFNRKLSKREKKEKKKKEKKEKAKGKDSGKGGKDSLAEKLYTELPETSFTRSISNPEAVMRRRRQQKLEKKLQQFSQEGGPEAGGTLRIFGESINQDVPYKTILLSTRDTAAFAVKEILEKYGKEKEDPSQYCLVQVIMPYVNGDSSNGTGANGDSSGIYEYILYDDDCPLIIERSHNKSRGVLTFHIRRRPPDQPRRRKKKMDGEHPAAATMMMMKNLSLDESTGKNQQAIPYLVEVNADGGEMIRPGMGAPKRHPLGTGILEIGSDLSNLNPSDPKRQLLQLFGPNIQPHHCTIANTDGIIIVTPVSRESETYINGTRIYETTVMKPGMVLRLGKMTTFKFVVDDAFKRHSQLSAGPAISLHNQGHQSPLETSLNSPSASSINPSYETTFDADGKVETSAKTTEAMGPPAQMLQYSTGSLQRHQTMGSLATAAAASRSSTSAVPSSEHPTMPRQPGPLVRKGDNILPAILEVGEEVEDLFLNTIIKRIDPNQVQFKLCITYSLYMVTRYRASTYFKPEITPEVRAELLISFCIKYANLIQQTINEHQRDQQSLAFWLANSSEILHFLKNDRHLSAFTFDSQDILAESVQMAFNHLVSCQQQELQQEALASFTTDIVSEPTLDSMTQNILKVLSNSMQLLRRFRVNAALTIQLFSQLFHFINMWLFNKVIGTPDSNFCSRIYGIKLRQCIGQIELWAEKQGLELAAECHLARIIQTAVFLQSPKKSPEDLNALVANFYKLNSVQLRALCERYQPAVDEIPFSAENIQSMVKMARSTTDELILKDGREIRLEEECDLQLPFLLPEDGYSCDIVRGIPTGLQEFVQTLVQAGVCSLTIQPTASGYWTIYFINFQAEPPTVGPPFQQQQQPPPSASPLVTATLPAKNGQPNATVSHFMAGPPKPHMSHMAGKQQQPMMPPGATYPAGYGTVRMMPEPEVQVIKLQKINNGIGLSIVAARGTNQSQLGIYIKSVVKDGAADLDGRLEAGDQLLEVDGQSLIGITQEKAAELMTQTGPVVTLKVAKQGALYHGLGGILTQQSSSSVLAAAQQSQAAKSQLTMRPRFIGPNTGSEYGMHPQHQLHHQQQAQHRFNGQYSPMLSAGQYPGGVGNNGQQRMPGYNSLPLSLGSYNYRGAVPSMASYSQSTVNMRPESQMSYSSQTPTAAANAIMNSAPLVNNGGRTINMSTASLPGNPAAAASHYHPEERHYQNIQLYQLNPPSQQSTAQSSVNPMPKLSPNVMVPANLVMARSMLHGSHSSLQQPQHHQHQHHHQSSSSSQDQLAPSRPVSAIVTTRDQEQIFNANNGLTQQQQRHQQQQRDLMRQEAKMEEIREELRRRDDRLHHHGTASPMSRAVSLSNSAINPIMATAPNGSLRSRFPSQQTLSFNSQPALNGGFRSNGGPSLNVRANGPPPPAPKPMRAMTLMMGANNNHQQQVRYGPSGYPPSSKSSGTQSPSHWDREETTNAVQQQSTTVERRQDDDARVNKGILKSTTVMADDGDDTPPPLPNSPPPMESANQRLDRLLLSTVGATKNNDQDEMVSAPTMRTGVLKNTTTGGGSDQQLCTPATKKVSWNDNPAATVMNRDSESDDDEEEDDDGTANNRLHHHHHHQPNDDGEELEDDEDDDDEPQEDRFSLQDIDDVLGAQGPSGKDWLNSINYVGGSTPGVIGAQEVYNDPRKRIEAERFKSNQNQTSTDKLPEKLTFQEKMKMFAKSTGGS